jgi:hypothetical protein
MLTVVLLVVLRSAFLPDFNADGTKNNLLVFKSLFDNLVTTIVVTGSVALALAWFRAPLGGSPNETYLAPWEIGKTLRDAATESREWYYLGHRAMYIRANILPILNRTALESGTVRRVRLIILNPENISLCEVYATYRIYTRSANQLTDGYSAEALRIELLATILRVIDLHRENPLLEIDIGLQGTLSIFRVDIASDLAIVTQEDGQLPAILYPAGSHFYVSYLREWEMIWRQAKHLRVSGYAKKFEPTDTTSIRSLLSGVGLTVEALSDEDLLEAARQSKLNPSPYPNA